MECLKTDKICPNTNKKCKTCILDECKGALKMLEIQAQHGMVTPELLNDTIQNMEELQKLNEEVMTMKVPSAITLFELDDLCCTTLESGISIGASRMI